MFSFCNERALFTQRVLCGIDTRSINRDFGRKEPFSCPHEILAQIPSLFVPVAGISTDGTWLAISRQSGVAAMRSRAPREADEDNSERGAFPTRLGA